MVGLACATATPVAQPAAPTATIEAPPSISVFDLGRTAYGFFPTPPDATLESVLNHFEAMGEHGDFILVQPNIPWEDFQESVEGESERRTDLRNQVTLARQNDLKWIFVVDPLNGLNRREFFGLPAGWAASFGNPDVRAAFASPTSPCGSCVSSSPDILDWRPRSTPTWTPIRAMSRTS